MNEKLELLKEVQTNVLEEIVSKFGNGRDLTTAKLSIWEVKGILYDKIKEKANDIIERDMNEALEEFSR